MTSYNKHIFLPILSLIVLLIATSGAGAQVRNDEYGKLYTALRAEEDSLANANLLVDGDTLQISGDSLTAALADTLVTDSTSGQKEDVLDAPVAYQADDSLVWIVADAKAYLYKNSKVDYQKIGLTAEQITVDTIAVAASASCPKT